MSGDISLMQVRTGARNRFSAARSSPGEALLKKTCVLFRIRPSPSLKPRSITLAVKDEPEHDHENPPPH